MTFLYERRKVSSSLKWKTNVIILFAFISQESFTSHAMDIIKLVNWPGQCGSESERLLTHEKEVNGLIPGQNIYKGLWSQSPVGGMEEAAN